MKVITRDSKEYVLCGWRKRYVRLTPEEYVRQQFLHMLAEQYHYPAGLMAVEVQLSSKRRADALIYNEAMQALVLIEFKAETVALTPKVLDQIACYNRQFRVPYLMLCNGPQIVVAQVEDHTINFLPTIPYWNEINQS